MLLVLLVDLEGEVVVIIQGRRVVFVHQRHTVLLFYVPPDLIRRHFEVQIVHRTLFVLVFVLERQGVFVKLGMELLIFVGIVEEKEVLVQVFALDLGQETLVEGVQFPLFPYFPLLTLTLHLHYVELGVLENGQLAIAVPAEGPRVRVGSELLGPGGLLFLLEGEVVLLLEGVQVPVQVHTGAVLVTVLRRFLLVEVFLLEIHTTIDTMMYLRKL